MKPIRSAFSMLVLVSASMVCFASTSHAKKERADTSPASYVENGVVGCVITPSSPAFDIQIAEMRIEYFDATPSIERLPHYRFDKVAISGAKKTHRGFPSETLARARTFDC